MQQIEIRIGGITPLLLHNPLGMSPASDGLGKKKIPTHEEEAEKATYRLGDKQLYIPSPAFRSCLVSAAKGRRFGKTAATTVVKGSVFVLDDNTPLTDPSGSPLHEYEIDARRVVVQKAAILRARPKLEKWGALIRFEIDPDFITEAHVHELLAIGGRTVGVGDYRPEKSGPFGRFRLV